MLELCIMLWSCWLSPRDPSTLEEFGPMRLVFVCLQLDTGRSTDTTVSILQSPQHKPALATTFGGLSSAWPHIQSACGSNC